MVVAEVVLWEAATQRRRCGLFNAMVRSRTLSGRLCGNSGEELKRVNYT